MRNRRAVGLLNPIRDKKTKARTGGRRDGTYVHGLSRSWKVEVCKLLLKKCVSSVLCITTHRVRRAERTGLEGMIYVTQFSLMIREIFFLPPL